jgi:acetyltransferase-like isoleucine patch superfamily enzyme
MIEQKQTIINKQLRDNLPNRYILLVWKLYYKIFGVKLKKSTVIFPSAKLLRNLKNISIGNAAIIKSNAQICACNKSAYISIGDRTTIGYYTFIYSSESIVIGNDCMIAPFVYIVDSNHGIALGINMNKQENNTKKVFIGNDVWIGANVTILPGVTIEDGSIIAAGSVVNSNVMKNSIYGGIPAKIISKRK